MLIKLSDEMKMGHDEKIVAPNVYNRAGEEVNLYS
jgi:hypothetical protein